MKIPKNLNIINLSAKLIRKVSELLIAPREYDNPAEKIILSCINILVPSFFILTAFLAVDNLKCIFFHSGFAGFVLFLAFAFYLGECIKHYDD